jgi:hypothetical protein
MRTSATQAPCRAGPPRRWRPLRALGALCGVLVALPAAAAGVPPADAAEIVETLLGMDPARYATPLDAMKGRAELYERYRTAARDGDATAMRVWLLIAHTAIAKADAATSEGFSEDLLPVFRAQPRAMLAALADNAWLVPATCYYLGRHFDFQGRQGAGRAEFVAAQEGAIRAALAGPVALRCLAQIREPRAPR